MNEIIVPAHVDSLTDVLNFIHDSLQSVECSIKAQMQIEMAVEEIFVNIANYAYHPEDGNATIRFAVKTHPLQVIIQFLDSGRPYNPLEKEDPNISLNATERDIGGLGIFIVKQNMNSIDYDYIQGENILTIKKDI